MIKKKLIWTTWQNPITNMMKPAYDWLTNIVYERNQMYSTVIIVGKICEVLAGDKF